MLIYSSRLDNGADHGLLRGPIYRTMTRALRERFINLLKLFVALQDCHEALVLDPGRAKALYRRGQAKENLGDFDGALDDMRRAVRSSGSAGVGGERPCFAPLLSTWTH
jgi:tetratricopeptide (TPR) repeat protein